MVDLLQGLAIMSLYLIIFTIVIVYRLNSKTRAKQSKLDALAILRARVEGRYPRTAKTSKPPERYLDLTEDDLDTTPEAVEEKPI